MIGIVGFGYWLYNQQDTQNNNFLLSELSQINHTQPLIDLDYKETQPTKSPKDSIYSKDSQETIIRNLPPKPQHSAQIKPPIQGNKSIKPKVAIIIDDLAVPKDIESFRSLGLKLNLSLFPKHTFSQYNPEIAKTLDFYMIHLPLEAMNFKQEKVRVLHTGDSLKEIQSYIATIKQDFPRLKYINNHTGSRYTSSKNDMQKLLRVLDMYNITFVDSKTSTSTVIKDIYATRQQIYLKRDIFLDNQSDTKYIANQLEKALHLADKNGFVIAIGHPKQATLQVLKQYKKRLKQHYELVYMNELEEFLKTTRRE